MRSCIASCARASLLGRISCTRLSIVRDLVLESMKEPISSIITLTPNISYLVPFSRALGSSVRDRNIHELFNCSKIWPVYNGMKRTRITWDFQVHHGMKCSQVFLYLIGRRSESERWGDIIQSKSYVHSESSNVLNIMIVISRRNAPTPSSSSSKEAQTQFNKAS